MTEWTNPETSKPKTTSKVGGIDDAKYEIWQKEIKKREEERRREDGIKWLGGPVPFDQYTFPAFDLNMEVMNRYKMIVADFNIHGGNLFLLGPVGTGKTHLMTAKAHQVYDLGGSVRIFNKESFKELLEYTGWLGTLKGLSFVGLDDLDEFGSSKRIQAAIKLMIQERENHGKHGIFITSNKPLATLGIILGGKVQDRIDGYFQNLVIPPETKSMRGILKAAKKNA